MGASHVDIRQLEQFLAVARHGGFTKASEARHVSQSALSKMVKTLENELDVALFDRSTRRVRLTDAGEIVERHALMVLKAVERLHEALEEVREAKLGKLTLGLPPVIGATFFPGLIADFRRRHPGVELAIVEEGSRTLETLLQEGAIDLAVVVLPTKTSVDEVGCMPLYRRELRLVVPSNHRFAACRGTLPFSELRGESFVMFRRGFALYDKVYDACIEQGFEPRVVCESTQWDFMIELVASGLGIAFLPESVCGRLDASKAVALSGVRPTIRWDLTLIWRKESSLSFASRAWVKFLEECMQEKEEEGIISSTPSADH